MELEEGEHSQLFDRTMVKLGKRTQERLRKLSVPTKVLHQNNSYRDDKISCSKESRKRSISLPSIEGPSDLRDIYVEDRPRRRADDRLRRQNAEERPRQGYRHLYQIRRRHRAQKMHLLNGVINSLEIPSGCDRDGENGYSSRGNVDSPKSENIYDFHRNVDLMANYKAKVTALQTNLGTLLAQKKALNSRVVTEEYDNFKITSDKVLVGEATPGEVRLTLIGLEKALKKEGLFKNVKSGFVHIKKEFLMTSTGRTPRSSDSKEKPQRGTTAVISNRVPPDRRKTQSHSTGGEDVKTLNKAVGKLFDHLRIQKLSDIARESTGLSLAQGRPPSAHAKKPDPSDNSDEFKDIIKKVKNLERELQRQKASQNLEIMRLSEENSRLKNAVTDMRKENDKLKGLQPITRAAKDRQVEHIQETYNKQKKGIEGKIREMESELQSSLEQTLQEKEELEQMIMDGVSKLKLSISALHKRIVGERAAHEKTKTSLTLDGEWGEKKSIDDLIWKVAQIEVEAQLLEEKNSSLGRILTEKDSEITELRDALLKITEEVSRLHGSINDLHIDDRVDLHGDSKPPGLPPPLPPVPGLSAQSKDGRRVAVDKQEMKATLQKLQSVNSTIQKYKGILHDKERSTSSPKGNGDLIPLKAQINKIHDDLMKLGDPALLKESSSSDKSDGSRESSPMSQRDRADEINHLLKKLTRVEKACIEMKTKYEGPEVM